MKKFTAIFMALALALSLAACGNSAVSQSATSQSTVSAAMSESAAATRTITDALGRKLEIPSEVKTIVCLGSGAPRMAAYLGVIDMLVGVEEHDAEKMTVLRDYNPVYRDQIKDLPVVGAGGGSGSNNGYAEQIITVAPDVILAGFSAESAEELQAQTGIPVISVRYTSKGLANDTFYDSLRIFAETVGAQQRCEELLSFIDACKDDLNSRTKDVADSDKLTAYAGAVTFSGRHGFTGTYSSFGPLDAVNAINVADTDSETGYYETDLEQIITWNPDVIFLDPGNMDIVNDEYKTNPNYFATVRAVQQGNVYTMPAFNNCSMNISYALMDAYYAGIVLFPEQFKDVDIAEKSAEILEFFVGENTYDIMAEGGLYYGTLKLGE